MVDVTTLSGAKLEALIAERDEADYATTCEACQLGFGNAPGNAIRRFADGTDTWEDRRLLLCAPGLDVRAFAQRWVAAADAAHEAREEMHARRRYHGGTKPIKRAA